MIAAGTLTPLATTGGRSGAETGAAETGAAETGAAETGAVESVPFSPTSRPAGRRSFRAAAAGCRRGAILILPLMEGHHA